MHGGLKVSRLLIANMIYTMRQHEYLLEVHVTLHYDTQYSTLGYLR